MLQPMDLQENFTSRTMRFSEIEGDFQRLVAYLVSSPFWWHISI